MDDNPYRSTDTQEIGQRRSLPLDRSLLLAAARGAMIAILILGVTDLVALAFKGGIIPGTIPAGQGFVIVEVGALMGALFAFIKRRRTGTPKCP